MAKQAKLQQRNSLNELYGKFEIQNKLQEERHSELRKIASAWVDSEFAKDLELNDVNRYDVMALIHNSRTVGSNELFILAIMEAQEEYFRKNVMQELNDTEAAVSLIEWAFGFIFLGVLLQIAGTYPWC